MIEKTEVNRTYLFCWKEAKDVLSTISRQDAERGNEENIEVLDKELKQKLWKERNTSLLPIFFPQIQSPELKKKNILILKLITIEVKRREVQ